MVSTGTEVPGGQRAVLRVTGTGAGTTLVALQVSWHRNLPALSPRPRLRQGSTSRSRSSPGAAGRCPGLAVPEDLQGHPEAGVAKLLQKALSGQESGWCGEREQQLCQPWVIPREGSHPPTHGMDEETRKAQRISSDALLSPEWGLSQAGREQTEPDSYSSPIPKASLSQFSVSRLSPGPARSGRSRG